MTRRILAALFCAAVLSLFTSTRTACAQEAYGRQWVSSYSTQDWDRFYHYPYVYYPQNFWGDEYYRSSESLYYRYPRPALLATSTSRAARCQRLPQVLRHRFALLCQHSPMLPQQYVLQPRSWHDRLPPILAAS